MGASAMIRAMEGKDALLEDLSRSTAATVAVALAEWGAVWKALASLPEGDEQAAVDFLASAGGEARLRALLLTTLSRSIDEYGDDLGQLPLERDPRQLAPLLQALAESYSLLALAAAPSELQTGLLLSPSRLRSLLTPERAAFIRAYGEEEAMRVLATDM